MYEGAVTGVRTCDGISNDFSIKIGLHQGSALSPYLFALVLDQVTKDIQGEIPWCMLFADDVALIGESKQEIEGKLELWRQTLESKGFRLSRTKTEYPKWDFDETGLDDGELLLDGQIVPRKESFRYMGSMIQSDGDIKEDVRHRSQSGWAKWRLVTGVLCDRKVPIKLKGKFYRTAIRPAMLYGAEYWATRSAHLMALHVTEMRMLRWACGHIRRDKIRNGCVYMKLWVAPVKDILSQHRLRWFGHLQRRPPDAPVRLGRITGAEGRMKRPGRPKLTWDELIKWDLSDRGLERELALDRSVWKAAIHVKETAGVKTLAAYMEIRSLRGLSLLDPVLVTGKRALVLVEKYRTTIFGIQDSDISATN
ncbi:uncharacterized protein LOC113315650 [Papaver somniferum]|uniref:uncharacterized protein LOC113315650 n=1 Tax=Papaver somniferum TaxID=3469 RepID=UPI000E6FC1FB|nr:uncharacterized protein LOC113315650 [Papaver somniferum]